MSANQFRKYATSSGAELLEHVLETPSHRRSGNATQPTADEPVRQSACMVHKAPPSLTAVRQETHPSRRSTSDETPDRPAGGLPVVKAKLQEGFGLMADFYLGNCPDCGTTRSVEMQPQVNICSCGNPFFAEVVA